MQVHQAREFMCNSEPVFAGSGNHSLSYFMYVPWA